MGEQEQESNIAQMYSSCHLTGVQTNASGDLGPHSAFYQQDPISRLLLLPSPRTWGVNKLRAGSASRCWQDGRLWARRSQQSEQELDLRPPD